MIMASIIPVTQYKSIWKEPKSSISPKNKAPFLSIPNSSFAQNLNLYSTNQSSSSILPNNKALLSIPKSSFDQSLNLFSRNQPSFSILPKNKVLLQIPNSSFDKNLKLFSRNQPYLSKMVLVGASSASSAATSEKSNKRYPGEAKGFVEEMRYVAMKLHTKDQAKEGEKEPRGKPLGRWEPSVEGYLKFLVDSKLVYDTLEGIMDKAAFPEYAEFKNTGLERSECLAKDLEWFKEQGNTIPEPSSPGVNYAKYLEDISQTNPQAFICHFYNTYFAHTAGGRMIGRKVAQKILNNKELEFYKWEGDLSQLLQNVRDQINQVAEKWTREDKDHCLEETEKSFMFSGEILRLILI